MTLREFITSVLGFLGDCFSSIFSLIEFVFDFPTYVLDILNTFPSYFLIGFECILIFIAISVVLKIYRDLH